MNVGIIIESEILLLAERFRRGNTFKMAQFCFRFEYYGRSETPKIETDIWKGSETKKNEEKQKLIVIMKVSKF